jgi:hypothetical protein
MRRVTDCLHQTVELQQKSLPVGSDLASGFRQDHFLKNSLSEDSGHTFQNSAISSGGGVGATARFRLLIRLTPANPVIAARRSSGFSGWLGRGVEARVVVVHSWVLLLENLEERSFLMWGLLSL